MTELNENTHQERVLNYIRKFGSISSMEAFQDLGITRLGAVIFCLRQKGYKLKSTTEYCKSRFGKMAHYTRYTEEAEKA